MSLYEDITGKKYVEPSKKEKQAIPDWMANNTTTQKKKKNKWFKESSYFDDGYDIGDVTKTIIKTGGDVLTNVGKGFLNTVEGVVDTARTGIGDLTKTSANVQADIWDFLGNKAYASNLRKAGQDVKDLTYKNAKMDVTGAILGETNDLFKENWSAKMNEGSVLGTVPQSVSQGIGNIGAFVGLSALTGGSTMATFGNSFTSAYGNTLTNGLRNGLDEKEAKGQAITSGLAEAISEQFFQGIPGLKSAGWADNLISKPIGKYFSGKTGKVALKVFDSLGEGFEEVISNVLQSTFEGIRKGDNVKQIWNDATGQITNEETRDAFISALISSALTNGGSALITNAQKNQIIDAYAKEHDMTTKETKDLFDSIVEKKANLEETSNYKERVETEEGISKQLVKDLQNNKIDLNELFKQTPNSVKEMQFRFNQDEAKNVKSEKQNILANDMARLNNEKSNHELYKVVNAIQSANNTQQYHITTTEGLYEMGIVNKDANGNYTMPDGSPYVPRGLNYKNGEIYINADVGSKSGTQAVYHEMLEGFKKASPEQYNQFKQMITDIIGEKNIQKEFDTYKSMYGEELTDDIRDEIINDKFGELAENQNFINKIADNRNVLEKFIDSIKNMIKYVKGTNEERQLMKLQKNLEKEFAKRYKETDFSQGEGDTAYSLGKHYGDLGKGEDTFYGRMYNARRGTGHFGTGTYFVNENYQPGENSSYATRPTKTVEFDDYDNLFKPANRDAGFDLHDALKEVNYNNTPISKELYDKLLPYYEASFNTINDLLSEEEENNYQNVRGLLKQAGIETEEYTGYNSLQYERDLEDKITDVLNNYDRYQKAERDLKRVLGITDEQFKEAIDKVRQTEKEYQNHSYDQKLKDDSLSTVFMKTLGYNGVDVRGIEGLDDTQYGSVIYDLDNKTNVDEKINNLLLTNSDVYDMVDSKTLKENGLTVEDLISKDLDDIDKLEDAWRKANYENSSKNFHEVPIEEAVSTIRNNNTFWRLSEGWFRGADSAYKPNIEKVIIMTPELRNAGMNIAYQNYKDYIDKNISFDDFINKEMTLYRGSNDSGFVDADKFVAFSFRKDMVEKHFGNRNKEVPISELKVKMKDTLGSYQTTGEAEVLVPRSIVDKNNIRYSLSSTKDSQGRNLTPQQQEYFKDSKVVDENGNLKVMYHGGTSEYNVFDKSKIGSKYDGYSRLGKGFYFTDNLKDAEMWATNGNVKSRNTKNIKEVYLNITNPFDVDKDYSIELADLKNEYPNYVDDFNLRAGYRLIRQINEFSKDLGFNSTELLQRLGYDGIIGYDEVAVFDSNQIKNVDNTNPTSNEDIRYSLAPTGEMVDNEGNKVEFEVSEVDTELPIRNENKLMVLHNLGENKMNGIMDLDGIPVPSLAVTNPYKVDHSGFGEATLIFKKDTIDPANRLNEVYDRDIWSPTQPRVEYDLDNQVLRDMAKENHFDTESDEILHSAKLHYLYSENLGDLVNSYGIESALDRMKSDRELKYLYQKSTNPDYQAQFKTKEYSNKYSNETLQKYVDLYNSNKFNDMSLYDFWYHYLNYGDMQLTDDQRAALKATVRDIVYEEYVKEAKDMYKTFSDTNKNNMSEDAYIQHHVDAMLKKFDNSYFDYVDFIRDAVGLDQYGDQLTIDEDATLKQVEQDTNQAEYEKWVDDTFGKMLRATKKGIRNDKELFTASGNRRSFDKLHEEYNLENLVKVLTSKDTVGGEEGFGSGSNFGTLQAKMGHRFSSIEDIKSYEDRLSATNNQDIEDLKNAIYDDMAELNNYKKYYSEYSYFDNAGYALNDYAEYKIQDLTNLKKALEKNDIDTTKVPTGLLNKVVNEINQLKTIPTDYFEAKPQRAVGLDEIGIGLIPNTWSEETKQRMRDKGIKFIEYDKSIEGERQRIEKDLTDYMFSLTSNQNIDSKEVAPIGTTTDEMIAPIREDISNLTEKIDNLSTQLETMQNGAEIAPVKGYVEQYKPQKGEDKNSTPLNEESAETYANALSNDEGYIKSLEESAENYIEPNGIEQSNAVKLSNKAGDLLGLSTEQIMNLRERIKEYAQKDYTVDEIREDLEKNFASRTYTETSNAMKEAKQIIRQTPLNVSQAIKNDIADYGDFKKKHFGKMTFSRNGLPVDVAYKKLMESSLKGVLDQDIVNPTDELLELARIVDESNKYEVEIVATPEELDNAADFIQQSILNTKYEEQEASLNSLDRSLENYEELAPTTIRTQESIDNTIQNRDIAPIRQDVVDKTNPKNQNKLPKAWQTLQETMVNRNYVIDKLAKTTGNQDVKYKGDAWNNVSSEAQYNINKFQTDNNYNRVGKSIKDIFEPSKKAGLYEAFNDYLIQKSNIERTDAGKGSAIPYEVSVQLVNMYENENPQFKTWAKDVYKYFDNVLQDQVDSGLISQEEYDYFRGETGIYRSYVPFYPGEFVASRYFDNEGNLKTPTTLKRSKGGAHDILAVEDSMAKQTYAYKNAIRQNDLFNEIVSTLGANDNGLAAELRGNPTDLDMSLFVDPETNDKYVTAYVEGDRYSAKISDELYNELGRVKENQVKEFEDNLSGILNPIQKVSNVRRNLLTAWNPVFLLRNGIKDIQDAMINSKQTGEMLKAYFGVGQKAAIFELKDAKTKEAQQFLAAYGTEGTYGDYTGDTKSKFINKISSANELIELAPRFAEFKATLKNGGSVQQALYNAREVTTSFGRGGYLAKAMNRNGFTFLNANIQGLDKIVRNLSGENGAKGVVSVVAKGALFGIAPAILNELLFGAGDDKDEEYEALPDYVKDNYYLIKLQNGKFLRIPKGRVLSVIGSAARRTIEAVEGEENAFEGWGENAWSQIGVGDSGGLQTIFTPIRQAIKNEAWYGGDIVPTRLQKLPAEEQYDEKTDAISKKIGEIFKVSPKKVNYVIDQYSGGIGDLFLPTITPATSNGAEGVGYLTAPLKDAFVVNSTDDNKYASEFYSLKDELQTRSNSSKATDEEQLRYKYINSVSSELSNLYTERREVQADTTLSKSGKYEKVQKIQDEINALARDGIVQSKDIKVTEDYATVNDVEYYKDDEGKWQKLSDNDILDTAGMTGIEKSTYFHAKEKISVYNKEYKEQTKDLNKSTDTDLINQYAAEKKQNIINAVINSGLSNEDKAILYSNYYSSEETMNNIVNAGYDVDDYITAMNDIEILREEYSAKKGYSTAQRKALTISYVDSLNMNEVQKAMMLRQYYSSFDSYNNEIVNYVSNLNISQEEKIAILKQCKFTVKQKNGDIVVSW